MLSCIQSNYNTNDQMLAHAYTTQPPSPIGCWNATFWTPSIFLFICCLRSNCVASLPTFINAVAIQNRLWRCLNEKIKRLYLFFYAFCIVPPSTFNMYYTIFIACANSNVGAYSAHDIYVPSDLLFTRMLIFVPFFPFILPSKYKNAIYAAK